MAATEPRLSQLPFINCSNDDKPDGSKSEAQQRKPISVAIPKHKAHGILNIPSSLVTPPVSRTASSFDLPHISPPNKQSASSKAAQAHLPPQKLPPLPNVTCVVRARIPTTSGTEIFLHLYQNDSDNKEHLAIVFGNRIRSRSLDEVREGETEMDRMIRGAYTGKLYPGRTSSTEEQEAAEAAAKEEEKSETPLVRIHSECYTGETAWSARCDCGEQLDEAARLMGLEGEGVIVYLRQEGRGIGLSEKLKAYNLQDLGNDTVEANLLLRHPADARTYGLATAILCDLDCNHVRLLTNNPDKVAAVEGPNKEVEVVSRVAMVPKHWRGEEGGVKGKEVGDYLRTKIEKMGHMLGMPEQ